MRGIGNPNRNYGIGLGTLSFDLQFVDPTFVDPFTVPLIYCVNALFGYACYQYILAPLIFYSNTFDAPAFKANAVHLYNDGEDYPLINTLRLFDKV